MGADSNITILEDTSHTLNLSDFGFSDSSDNDLLNSITIINPPTTGTLTLAGAVVGSNTTIQPSDIDNQQLLYTPAENDNGLASDTIVFAVQDDGGTPNGGIDTDPTPNTITIDIDAVNDEPTGTDNTVTLIEDSTFDFDIADFGFSDTDNHTLLSVTISELPLNGQLILSGSPVTTGQVIPAASVNSLQFTPAANDNGIGYDSLAFQVQDNGGTLNGGSDLDATENRITIDVLPVNDAPMGADSNITILEDTSHTLKLTDFGFSDTDNHTLLSVTISELPLNGQLVLSGSCLLYTSPSPRDRG